MAADRVCRQRRGAERQVPLRARRADDVHDDAHDGFLRSCPDLDGQRKPCEQVFLQWPVRQPRQHRGAGGPVHQGRL